MDAILHFAPAVKDSQGLDAINRFYEFWKIITPILQRGHFVYCSGRSTILLNLGQGKYNSQSYSSPTRTEAILFDTLKENHIESIISQKFAQHLDQTIQKNLAEIIFRRTGGVPRFVAYAMDYLVTCKLSPSLENIQLLEFQKFFGESFRNYVKQKSST